MKVKVLHLLKASGAVDNLMIKCPVAYSTVRALNNLRKRLRVEADSIRAEQMKLVELHNGKLQEGTAVVEFPTPGDRMSFESDWNTFTEDEVEFDVARLDLSEYTDFIVFQNSGYDLDVLDPFILFEKE